MGTIANYMLTSGQLREYLYPGSSARNAAIRTQDYTTNYGAAIPISQGLRRISGVPIWMGPLKDDRLLDSFSSGPSIIPGDPNGPMLTQTARSLTRDFAIAFGYNLAPAGDTDLPKVRRVWINGALAFANGSTVQPIYFDPSTFTYSASFGKVATYSGVLYGAPTGAPADPALELIGHPLRRDAYQTNIDFTFYAGTETQMPDATIKVDKGDLTPAYRGMIYMVIKGLPVGTAIDTKRYVTFNDGSGSWGTDRAVNIPNALPKIDVELVDGTTISSTIQDFELLPEAVDSEFNAQILMPNWDKRQITVLNQDIGLQTYDMDAKAQIEVIPFVKTLPTDTFGDVAQFTDWDTVNDIIYSHSTGSLGTISACDRKTGIIYGPTWSNGFNLGFKDIDGGDPFVTGKPVDVVPMFTVGAIAHYLFSGEVHTAIYGGEFYTASCVLTPSDDGQDWPPAIPANSLHDFGGANGTLYTIQALPLLTVALEQGTQTSQDACFVACCENKAFLVYVTFSRYIFTAGSDTISRVWGKIAGVKQIYEAGDPACKVWSIVTSERDILIFNYAVDAGGPVAGQTTSIAKLKVTYDLSPDYAAAPGWKGYFPHETLVYDVPQPTNIALPVPSLDTKKFSNTINGEFLFQYIGSTYHINTDDGSASVEPVSYATKLSMIWDGATRTVYAHDINLQYCELGRAITGTVGLLKDYLRWFGLRAGFSAANISVDGKILDQVVGSIIVTTMDMAQLFNDLGRLYGFIWFVSGSVLKFVKNNQAPIKASATLTISNQPTDGMTITIGAVVYTFKLIPAAPYDVKIDSVAKETSLINLMKAINASGEDGFEYFSVTAAHPDVLATCPTDTTLKATAKIGGTAANSITVASSNTSKLTWGGVTNLSGGEVPPTAAINLTLDNMMAVQNAPVGEGAALVTTFPSIQTAAQAAEVLYYDLDAEYAPSSQKFVPDDGSDASGLYNIQTFNTTFVMAASEAYSRVTKVGAVNSTGVDVTQEFQLSQQFLRAEPSDIVSITIGTYNYTVRLDEVTFNGDYTISVSGVNYSFRDDIPVVVYLPPTRPEQTIAGPGDGMPGVFDAPFLEVAQGGTPGDFAVYSGVKTYGQAGWLSAQMSLNGGLIYTTAVDIPYGTASTVLPDTITPFLTDTTTVLRVTGKSMLATDLANATEDQFYNNENLLIVGKPGRWEYVAFKSVTALNSKVFEFSGLARGRRGTDGNVGTHAASDEVYLVKSVAAGFNNPLRIDYFSTSSVNTDGIYSVAGLPATRAPSSLTVTYTAESLKPFSPCSLAAVLVGGNDIDLTWDRRDRLSTVFITDVPPMSEAAEKYDLEILSAGVVKRTLTDLTSPAYTYTSANQTTDGFTPPLASLEIRVYQKGELGRGYPKQETLNVE